MAQGTKTVTANEWIQVTDGNATAITFQGRCASDYIVKGTVGATMPTDDLGALFYRSGEGEANIPLADLFPGLTGVNRLWAKFGSNGTIAYGHA